MIKRKFLVAIMLLLLIACTRHKPLYKSDFQQVDEFLNQFEGKRPGYALGIIQNGQLTYAKGYGLANLDYGIPLSDSSAFYIGSMAKQFTAAALLILEAEGKIDFNDPVTKHLPDFPKYDQEITISHLIHHTSGVRETNSLQLFQGIDKKFEEPFSTDDLLTIIFAQQHLNFQPGQEYRYSSGGYAVLAKIVEQISGQTFREFAKTKIFEPLGMTSTLVCDNHNEVIPNRAVSYWPVAENTYERRSQVFDAYGDGGIITTVKDLAKWDQAFYTDELGIQNFADKMYQKSTLTNGDTIDYARALNVWEYKGQKIVQHNGGMLGFRVDMVRFPTLKTSIILLGNSAYLNPTGDALKIAEFLLKDAFEEDTPLDSSKDAAPVSLSSSVLSQFSGYYWTDQTNYFRRTTLQNDSLFLDNGNLDAKEYLMPVSKSTFVVKGSNPTTHLEFNASESDLIIHFGNLERRFRKFDPTPPQQVSELNPYLGVYTSDELESTYTIFKETDVVFLKINKNEPRQIFPLPTGSGMVWNGDKMLWIGFGEIKFEVDDNNVVKGLTIGDRRVSGVKFRKKL